MPNWITIPIYRGIYEMQMFPYNNYMLFFSNEEMFFQYIQDNMYSSDYFNQRDAKEFDLYTDSYSIRISISMREESLNHLDDAFGLMLS